jgi:hypothetical protein
MAGFADRLGWWFKLCTTADRLASRATAHSKIDVGRRPVKRVTGGPCKSRRATHTPGKKRLQVGFYIRAEVWVMAVTSAGA